MLSEERFAVIDVETTGLCPGVDRVVEMACVLVDGDAVTRQWSTLVNPGTPIPRIATAVHGIGDADVYAAPAFSAALDDLCAVVEDRTVAAHNASFDLAFLAPLRPKHAICTVRLARLVVPDAPDYRNQTLRTYLRLDERIGGVLVSHRALADALITAQLLLACRRRCEPPQWQAALAAAGVWPPAREP